MKRLATFVSVLLCCCLPAFGQQTGSVSGKVTSPDGDALPGVTVEAGGDVLPRPRTATTTTDGEYRIPLLPPGNYVLTFSLPAMSLKSTLL